MKKSITIKSIVILICILLLVWNGNQKRRIEEDTKEIPIEYEAYDPQDEFGEYRQIDTGALLEIGTSIEMSSVSSLSDTDYYCMFVLSDGSVGVVKLESLDDYREYLCDSFEEMDIYTTKRVSIRGVTCEMVKLTPSILDYNTYEEYEEAQRQNEELSEILTQITLLDATAETPEFYIQESDLTAIPGFAEFIIWVTLIVTAWLLVCDIAEVTGIKRVILRKILLLKMKMSEPERVPERQDNLLQNGGWQCECGRINPAYTGTCACGMTKQQMAEKKEASTQKATIDLKSGVFLAPISYEGEVGGLSEPDKEIHVWTKVGEMLRNGKKLQLIGAVPDGYHFAQKADGRLMHIRLLKDSYNKEWIPLFIDFGTMFQIFGNNIHVACISYEDAKEQCLLEVNKDICAGIVVAPGMVNQLITREELSVRDAEKEICEMARKHAPANLYTDDEHLEKSVLDAVEQIIPNYDGICSIGNALVLNDPVKMKENISQVDDDTLLIFLKVLIYESEKTPNNLIINTVKKHVITVLEKRGIYEEN